MLSGKIDSLQQSIKVTVFPPRVISSVDDFRQTLETTPIVRPLVDRGRWRPAVFNGPRRLAKRRSYVRINREILS